MGGVVAVAVLVGGLRSSFFQHVQRLGVAAGLGVAVRVVLVSVLVLVSVAVRVVLALVLVKLYIVLVLVLVLVLVVVVVVGGGGGWWWWVVVSVALMGQNGSVFVGVNNSQNGESHTFRGASGGGRCCCCCCCCCNAVRATSESKSKAKQDKQNVSYLVAHPQHPLNERDRQGHQERYLERGLSILLLRCLVSSILR